MAPISRVSIALLTTLVISFLLSGGLLAAEVAGAPDVAKGIAAYTRGDYAAAQRELRPWAEQGNVDAQYALGVMYDKGQGVPQDDTEASNLFRLAALQGNAQAQAALGAVYFTGRGVPQNFVWAYAWLNLAAIQNLEDAENIRDLVARSLMTPSQVIEGRQLSTKLAAQIAARLGATEDKQSCVNAAGEADPLKGNDWYLVKGELCMQGCPAAIINFYEESGLPLETHWNGKDIVLLTNESRGYNFGFVRGEMNCKIVSKMTSRKE